MAKVSELLLAGFFVLAGFTAVASGADWPGYQGGNQRQGVCSESFTMPLNKLWVHQSAHQPAAAWPEMPAAQDYWHDIANLNATNTYDRAYHVAVVGRNLYYGSSAEDAVYCLDAETGETVWTFFTEGPVRLAPAVYKNKVYTASDDGFVYCLQASNGKLIWKYRPVEDDRRICGNGRVISALPVRSGIVVYDDTVYFGCGLFPKQGVYLCAVDAETGAEVWKHKSDISPQGYTVCSPKHLFVPTGRTAAVTFQRATGKKLGNVGSAGGSFAVVLDDMLVSGASEKGQLEISEPVTREKIVSTSGLALVADGSMSYILKKDSLIALDRRQYLDLSRKIGKISKVKEEERTQAQKQQLVDLAKQRKDCIIWKTPCDEPYSLIMAGAAVFVGGNGEVSAFNANDGQIAWSGQVDGKAYGLAAGAGCLFVSTDKGAIHCFTGVKKNSPAKIVKRNFTVPPRNAKSRFYEQIARGIIEKSGVDKGYCVVQGSDSGQLAYELAMRSELGIVGIENDAQKADAARKRISRSGLYGKRISIHRGSFEKIPWQDYFANLVVCEVPSKAAWIAGDASEMHRILNPKNGKLILVARANKTFETTVKAWAGSIFTDLTFYRDNRFSWAVAERKSLSGTGKWTHLYAGPSNTSCSGENNITDKLDLAWFGKPGPRTITDRHHRSMSPLFINGQLFIYGDNRVISADAYNGTVLWNTLVPGSRRLGMMNDCGNMCVADDALYIAAGSECWSINVDTGLCRKKFKAPSANASGANCWGYIATDGGQLFGSMQKPTASFAAFGFGGETVGQIEGDFKLKAMSEGLFSVNRHTGETIWKYSQGAVLNSAIVIGSDCVFFIENRTAEMKANPNGRVSLDHFCKEDVFLVALDKKTGGRKWEERFKFPYQHQMFLCCSQGKVIVTGSHNIAEKANYALYAFDADTGKLKWQTNTPTAASVGGVHGEQWQHPAIAGGKIYLTPRTTGTLYEYDLQTGRQSSSPRPKWGGCGTISASTSHIFYRNGNPEMQNLERNRQTKITAITRPGCWINIIPAGAMLLIPEGSSGCTCGYTLQTSMGFIPVKE